MTGGAHPSASAGRRGKASLQAGLCWAGKLVGPVREEAKGVFFLILFPFKTNKQFEFKSRFESKHPKKQCTGMNATHTQLFI
jgi:hypothetical protein